LRAVNGALNFPGAISVIFDTPVDLAHKPIAFQATSSATFHAAAFSSLLAPFTRGEVWLWGEVQAPEQTLVVEGNSIGLPSAFPLKLRGCRVRINGTYGPLLAGMTGVPIVDPPDQSIAPATPVRIEFTTDMEGNARWGCKDLAEAMRGPDEAMVKVGSHPGVLRVRALLNVWVASLAGARVAEAYRRVDAALKALPGGQSAADIQAIVQTVASLPQTVGTPATAEANMRAAIAAIANAQTKQDLQQRFESGLSEFPALADRGWAPVAGSAYLVQPNLTGADSSAVPPSFSAPPVPPAPAQPTTTPAETPPQPPMETPVQTAGPIIMPTGPIVQPPVVLQPLGGEQTLGVASPLGFTLRGAEYTAATVRSGASMLFPLAQEKPLVVRFTLRNTQAEEAWVYWATAAFTAVDAMGMNREYCGQIFNEQTGESVDASLLPNQTIDCYTLVVLPSRGPAVRLLVRGEDGEPLDILLENRVTALAPPVADPADPTGATALTEVPAVMGVAYSLGNFVATVDRAQYASGAIADQTPQEGARFLVCTLRLKNQTLADQELYRGAFAFSLRGPQGDEVAWNEELLAAERDDPLDIEVTPGKETTVRVYFEVPAGMQPQALFVREGELGRGCLVSISPQG